MNDVNNQSSFKKARNTILLVFFISIVFGVGYFLGYKGFLLSIEKFPIVTINRSQPPEKELNFSLFWDVWDRLEGSYYDKSKIKESEMVYGAIKGMVSSLGDPYTVFFTPGENRIVQEDLNGNFEGVGIQLDFKDSVLTVVSPLPDTPAEKTGVKAGDQIIKITDIGKRVEKGTSGMSLQEAVALIRGERGTKVTLTLVREEVTEPFDVDIARGSINVASIKLEFVGDEGKIAHIKVLKFSGETKSEWQSAVNEIISRNVKGLILDLRNNPGGYLMGAVDIASEFVSDGTVVIEEWSDGKRQEYPVYGNGKLYKVPLVVLVNEGSASASEILAGAISDHKRGKIVGTVTFGKGTIQEPQELTSGSGLHLTISKWLTPNGSWLNGTGLEPDVIIEDNEETSIDEELAKAIELLS